MDPPATATEIVLAEDNPADVRLIREALEEYRIKGSLVVFTDGEMAIEYLDAIDAQLSCVPAIVIIDLNLPKKRGTRSWNECAGVRDWITLRPSYSRPLTPGKTGLRRFGLEPTSTFASPYIFGTSLTSGLSSNGNSDSKNGLSAA
jgi:CheY-like chemotaxis protein